MGKRGFIRLHLRPIFAANLLWVTLLGCSQGNVAAEQLTADAVQEVAATESEAVGTPPVASRPAKQASPKTASSAAATALPNDVANFVERRNACDHFRGEEAYDAERGEFLRKSLKETCTGSDRKLKSLREKYRRNPAVADKLKDYENNIEYKKWRANIRGSKCRI